MRLVTVKVSLRLSALCLIFQYIWFQADTVSGSEEIVPAAYRSPEVCATINADGDADPGRIVWDRASLHAPIMDDFDRRFTFAHELFHAVQFAYPKYRSLWCSFGQKVRSTGPGGWLSEGMADAMAWDWAVSRRFSIQPAPGSNWRYDGQRYYSDPLHHPEGAVAYYATSSFWHFLKRKCDGYDIVKAILANEPHRVDSCASVLGLPPLGFALSEEFDTPFLILDPVGKLLDDEEIGIYKFALTTAAAFYRDAGFERPFLKAEPAADYSHSRFLIRSMEIDSDAGGEESLPEPEPCKDSRPTTPSGALGKPDQEFLRLVDGVLSRFLAKLCGGKSGDGSTSPYCAAFEQEEIGGLAVAYTVFINEFNEDIVTGKRPFPTAPGQDCQGVFQVHSNSATSQLFRQDCVQPVNGAYDLDIPELASTCIQLNRPYSTRNTYHVIASGPLVDLDRLQLGWHGCPAAPLGTEPDSDQAPTGQKFWVLRPHLGRPGCTSKRDDYTLVFSNIARSAAETTAIRSVSVTIEAALEYQ